MPSNEKILSKYSCLLLSPRLPCYPVGKRQCWGQASLCMQKYNNFNETLTLSNNLDNINLIMVYGPSLIRNKLCTHSAITIMKYWWGRRPGPTPFTHSDILFSHLANLALLVAAEVTLESIKCADIWSEGRHRGIFSKNWMSPYLTCLAHAPKLSTEDNNSSVCAYFMTKMKIVD